MMNSAVCVLSHKNCSIPSASVVDFFSLSEVINVHLKRKGEGRKRKGQEKKKEGEKRGRKSSLYCYCNYVLFI